MAKRGDPNKVENYGSAMCTEIVNSFEIYFLKQPEISFVIYAHCGLSSFIWTKLRSHRILSVRNNRQIEIGTTRWMVYRNRNWNKTTEEEEEKKPKERIEIEGDKKMRNARWMILSLSLTLDISHIDAPVSIFMLPSHSQSQTENVFHYTKNLSNIHLHFYWKWE